MSTPSSPSLDLSPFGHHFIVGLSSYTLAEEEEDLLAQLRPAGIILFAKNIAPGDSSVWIPALKQLIETCKQLCGRNDLLVSIDHEGGRVFRLAPPVTHFPYAERWASQAEAVGRVMGRELRALGITVNLAPVLDIHNEAENPVIGPRAFGTDAETVIRHAIEFRRGLEAQGVLSCGKHFPGHGRTKKDSHLELPWLDLPRAELEQIELQPFAALIKEGLRAVMMAHVCYPALDPLFPASLSHIVITDFLRGRLGFSGVVMSDDLEMKALDAFSLDEKAEQFLRAGGDILLEGNAHDEMPLRKACLMAAGLHKAWQEGRLAEEIVIRSEERIRALLAYCASLQNSAEEAVYGPQMLNDPSHQALLKQIVGA